MAKKSVKLDRCKHPEKRRVGIGLYLAEWCADCGAIHVLTVRGPSKWRYPKQKSSG